MVAPRPPHFFVTGPYGGGLGGLDDFSVMVFITAGVGVTPAASVVAAALDGAGGRLMGKRTYVVWSFRSLPLFERVEPYFRQLPEKCCHFHHTGQPKQQRVPVPLPIPRPPLAYRCPTVPLCPSRRTPPPQGGGMQQWVGGFDPFFGHFPQRFFWVLGGGGLGMVITEAPVLAVVLAEAAIHSAFLVCPFAFRVPLVHGLVRLLCCLTCTYPDPDPAPPPSPPTHTPAHGNTLANQQ